MFHQLISGTVEYQEQGINMREKLFAKLSPKELEFLHQNFGGDQILECKNLYEALILIQELRRNFGEQKRYWQLWVTLVGNNQGFLFSNQEPEEQLGVILDEYFNAAMELPNLSPQLQHRYVENVLCIIQGLIQRKSYLSRSLRILDHLASIESNEIKDNVAQLRYQVLLITDPITSDKFFMQQLADPSSSPSLCYKLAEIRIRQTQSFHTWESLLPSFQILSQLAEKYQSHLMVLKIIDYLFRYLPNSYPEQELLCYVQSWAALFIRQAGFLGQLIDPILGLSISLSEYAAAYAAVGKYLLQLVKQGNFELANARLIFIIFKALGINTELELELAQYLGEEPAMIGLESGQNLAQTRSFRPQARASMLTKERKDHFSEIDMDYISKEHLARIAPKADKKRAGSVHNPGKVMAVSGTPPTSIGKKQLQKLEAEQRAKELAAERRLLAEQRAQQQASERQLAAQHTQQLAQKQWLAEQERQQAQQRQQNLAAEKRNKQKKQKFFEQELRVRVGIEHEATQLLRLMKELDQEDKARSKICIGEQDKRKEIAESESLQVKKIRSEQQPKLLAASVVTQVSTREVASDKQASVPVAVDPPKVGSQLVFAAQKANSIAQIEQQMRQLIKRDEQRTRRSLRGAANKAMAEAKQHAEENLVAHLAHVNKRIKEVLWSLLLCTEGRPEDFRGMPTPPWLYIAGQEYDRQQEQGLRELLPMLYAERDYLEAQQFEMRFKMHP